MKKLVGLVLGVGLLALVIVVRDWYDFTTRSEISKTEGVYGNPHLEVWIDTNRYMPAPLRHWACKTLLTREAEAMGVAYEATLRLAPYSCHPESENDTRTPQAALFDSYIDGDMAEAKRRKANDTQLAAIKACLSDKLKAAVKPEQFEAVAGGKDTQAIVGVSQANGEVLNACLKASGL